MTTTYNIEIDGDMLECLTDLILIGVRDRKTFRKHHNRMTVLLERLNAIANDEDIRLLRESGGLSRQSLRSSEPPTSSSATTAEQAKSKTSSQQK